MNCYYREFFGLGMLTPLFIFGAVFLCGDVIIEWLKRVIKVLNLK